MAEEIPHPKALALAKYFDWDTKSEQVREISIILRETYQEGFDAGVEDCNPCPTVQATQDDS